MQHIVYIVCDSLGSAQVLAQIAVQQAGVVRCEHSIYENRKPKTYWDFSLVNDRFLIKIIGEVGIATKVRNRLEGETVIWLDSSKIKNKNEEIVTIVGDLPEQAKIRAKLKGLPHEASSFIASKKVKKYGN